MHDKAGRMKMKTADPVTGYGGLTQIFTNEIKLLSKKNFLWYLISYLAINLIFLVRVPVGSCNTYLMRAVA
jgi:hypothetical protein